MNFLVVILLLSFAVGNEAQRHLFDRSPTLNRRWNRSSLSHSDCGVEWTPLKSFPYAEAFLYEPWNVRANKIFDWNRLAQFESNPFTPHRRMLGGFETINGQFPWTVHLLYILNLGLSGSCTGSLLTTRFVLTAAHCIAIGDTSVSRIRVYVGVDPPNRDQLTQLSVVNFFVRPCYSLPTIPMHDPSKCNDTAIERADVALIQVDPIEPVKHDNQPNSWYKYNTVCLSAASLPIASSLEVFTHEILAIAGWGVMPVSGGGEDFAEHLQWNEFAFHSTSFDDSIIHLFTNENSMLCQGDSGSPFVVQNSDGRWFQVGVTSGATMWSIPFGENCHYGRAIITNVMQPVIYDWIVKIVGENTQN